MRLQDTISVATARLYDMIMSNPVLGPQRAVFLTLEGERVPEARQIGESLNAQGGQLAMRRVADRLMQMVMNDWERRGDMRELDMCWDGIGEWKS